MAKHIQADRIFTHTADMLALIDSIVTSFPGEYQLHMVIIT